MSSERFDAAVRAFHRLNAGDPRCIEDGGALRPRELVCSERLTRWIARLAPEASEPLRLASWCQHLERWKYPRSAYPQGRTGYLLWRKDAARAHAARAAEVLSSVGYEADVVGRVIAILTKKAVKVDPDAQTMEDALCLAFLEDEFAEFAARHPTDKVVDIVRKTWRKMSDAGRAAALSLDLPQSARALLERALSPDAEA